MKIVAVIPARYGSSRFPGKPLADILGKPMIWWVYDQVKKIKNVDSVYVATDSSIILNECKKNSMECIVTKDTHPTGIDRVFEVAQKNSADFYLVVNGDEPLLTADIIEKILPSETFFEDDFYAANLMTEIKNPAEVLDFTNIKVVTDENDTALFMSRSPIPYPKAHLSYKYYKHVGVLIYSFKALHFFVNTPRSYNEKIEDINELRFIENHKPLQMIRVDSNTLSVDTPKDLEEVRRLMKQRLARNRDGGGVQQLNLCGIICNCDKIFVAELEEVEAA